MVKWIKISTAIFDDEKIRLIETLPDSDTVLIIWLKLLVMAGKCNESGMIFLSEKIPYTDEMLSTIMHRPVNSIRLALAEFQKLGMIEIVNNYISITNWEKHQNTDAMDRMKEMARLRQQKHRDKVRQGLICSENSDSCHVTTCDSHEVTLSISNLNLNISRIFEIWNNQENLIKHKKLDPHKKEIQRALDTYSFDEVEKAIVKYNEITARPGSLFAYKWTLKDFLRRGLSRFIDDAPDSAYIKSEFINDKPKKSFYGAI